MSKSSKVLLNHFLNGGQQGSLPHSGIRCLQNLCIQIVFQVVSFGFFQNFNDLDVHVAEIIAKEKQQPSKWTRVLPHFRRKCFSHVFEGAVWSSPSVARANFQKAFGYNVFLHDLILICGKNGIESKQESSGVVCKKHKISIGTPACLLQHFQTCVRLEVRTTRESGYRY